MVSTFPSLDKMSDKGWKKREIWEYFCQLKRIKLIQQEGNQLLMFFSNSAYNMVFS
jgi:hypothetical protein